MAESKTTAVKKPGSESLVEFYRQYKPTDILIRPYVDNTIPNMGLERYGQVLFEGTAQEQQLRCTETNGVLRFTTGLDEFAEAVKKLPDAEREAKVKIIRETVSKLEREIYGNRLDVNDEEFWEKTRFSPIKAEYWGQIKFTLGNEGRNLDPTDPHELLLIIAAEAGGFDDVAGSYEEAKTSFKPPKFYLEKRKDTRVELSKLKQIRDKAIFELYKLKTEEPQKLFWLTKNLLPIANQYKKTDPIDIWYGDLSSFIEATDIERDKRKAPGKFLSFLEKTDETLHIRAYVLEAAFLKKIITKADNKIYNRETGSLLGANLEEVVEFLKQPVNQRELNSLEEQIDPIWSR